MNAVNGEGPSEDSAAPDAAVNRPLIAALNRIVAAGTVGFALVAGFAAVPLIVDVDRAFHQFFHLGFPIGLLLYAATTALLLARRRVVINGDPWRRAAEADPGLARFARFVSRFMLVGWMVSVAVVLINHHLVGPLAPIRAVAVDTPLMLAVWILGAWAWTSWCRASLARADTAATDRLREYWRSVSRRQSASYQAEEISDGSR